MPHTIVEAASRRSAERIESKATIVRQKVYELILSRGTDGLTDEQVFHCFPDIRQNTLRPRRIELVQEGRVVNSGRVRLTRSGRLATVWVVPS